MAWGRAHCALRQVRVYDSYMDEGVLASDDRDATVLLTTSGLPLDTSATTAPGSARTITYTARDRAGNTASASRAVVVFDDCPAPERRCAASKACSMYGSCDPATAAIAAAALPAASVTQVGEVRREAVEQHL